MQTTLYVFMNHLWWQISPFDVNDVFTSHDVHDLSLAEEKMAQSHKGLDSMIGVLGLVFKRLRVNAGDWTSFIAHVNNVTLVS